VRECRLNEGIKELLEYVKARGEFDCIILSGGNSLFIGEVMDELGIE
jgi:phosphoserine phosphatase